jgi:hypothetical protein
VEADAETTGEKYEEYRSLQQWKRGQIPYVLYTKIG